MRLSAYCLRSSSKQFDAIGNEPKVNVKQAFLIAFVEEL